MGGHDDQFDLPLLGHAYDLHVWNAQCDLQFDLPLVAQVTRDELGELSSRVLLLALPDVLKTDRHVLDDEWRKTIVLDMQDDQLGSEFRGEALRRLERPRRTLLADAERDRSGLP